MDWIDVFYVTCAVEWWCLMPLYVLTAVGRLRQTEDHDDVRCHLAERLVSAHATDKQVSPAHDALASAKSEIDQLETALGTLDELKRWTDRFVEVQMMWVDCGARLDAGAALRVWNRMDRLMRRVAQQPDSARQLALFHAQLPALVAEAAALASQQHKLQGLDPATVTDLEASSLGNNIGMRAHVQLPHQWLPRVLRDICDSVEREFAVARCRPALVDATRKILEVTRDRNPYAFLNILYRPPPVSEDGESLEFVLYPSPQADAVARLLHADFELLREFAWWMEKPDASFWKTFARFMHCVRRVAVAFHHVMIHMYATVMQRQDVCVTADHVAQEIEASLAARASYSLQSESYGLAPWFATANDAIFHETYVMFPEVLVYVDAWRREFTVFEHGFAPAERARDYEVGYRKWETSKSWLEIAHQAKRAAQAWRRSKLGTRSFQPMSIQQLGRLEKDIKLRFGKITDLLYKQNLAKWSQQRYQHSRARVLMELHIMADDKGIQTSGATKAIKAEAPSPSEPVYTKEKCFRPPTLCRALRRSPEGDDHHCTVPDAESTIASPIDEEAILKWTDAEIDAHEQETERLYELQGGMLSASDALSLSGLFDPELEDHAVGYKVDEQAAATGLYANCRKLRGKTRNIVARGEEIALHSAAEALIQRPSLRTTPCNGDVPIYSGREDQHETTQPSSPTETLEAAIRDSAVRFLNLHHAAAADPDAQQSAQKLTLDAIALLRRVQHLDP